MRPTERKIIRALQDKPLSYYDLAAVVTVTDATLNRAVLALLDKGEIIEVQMGAVTGLALARGGIFRAEGSHNPRWVGP